MELTQEQKVAFYEDGYVTLEGVIPQAMINSARQAINHEIGKGVRNGFPDINTTSVITDLFNETPAFSLVESVLGKGNLQRLGAGTVQLNYTAPVGTQRNEPEACNCRSTVANRRPFGWHRSGPRFPAWNHQRKRLPSQFYSICGDVSERCARTI